MVDTFLTKSNTTSYGWDSTTPTRTDHQYWDRHYIRSYSRQQGRQKEASKYRQFQDRILHMSKRQAHHTRMSQDDNRLKRKGKKSRVYVTPYKLSVKTPTLKTKIRYTQPTYNYISTDYYKKLTVLKSIYKGHIRIRNLRHPKESDPVG